MCKYKIMFYWSSEDRAFVAETPELPGCMAHGDEQETTLRNIQDAMRFWIERAQELGRNVRSSRASTPCWPDRMPNDSLSREMPLRR